MKCREVELGSGHDRVSSRQNTYTSNGRIKRHQSFNFCRRDLLYIPTTAQTEKNVPKTKDRAIRALGHAVQQRTFTKTGGEEI